jgi:O-antigen ligase
MSLQRASQFLSHTPEELPEARLHPFDAPVSGEVTLGRYLVVMIPVVLVLLAMVGWTAMMGMPLLGIATGGVMFIALMLWRMEIGMFVMAWLILWDAQIDAITGFRVVMFTGVVVAAFGLILVIFATSGPRWSGMIKTAFVFGLWSLVATGVHFSPWSLERLTQVISHLLVMYLFARFCSKPIALRTLLWVTAVASMLVAAYSVVGVYAFGFDITFREEDIGDQERIASNALGWLMFPGVFLTSALIAELRSRLGKLIMLSGALLCSATVILTVARANTAAMILGVIAFLLTLKRLTIGKRVGVVIGLIALGLLVTIFASYFGVGEIWDDRMSESGLERGIQGRAWRFVGGISLAADNPIFGVGFGNEIPAYLRAGMPPTVSHNAFITIAMAVGLVGLVIYLVFLGVWLLGVWRLPGGWLRSGLIGWWIAFVGASMFNPAFEKKITWLAAGIAAAAIATYGKSRLSEGLAELYGESRSDADFVGRGP